MGGWYQRLKEAVDADIASLENRLARTWPSYTRDELRFLAGDAAFVALVVSATIFLIR
jgi:hypothetical protein